MGAQWIDDLTAATQGRVESVPASARPDRELELYAQLRDGPPAARLVAGGVADVQAAVRVAARADVPLSVRGGGHSGASFAAAEGGLMVDLGALRAVTVDAQRRVAVASPGATWGDYDAATQRYGLASTGGIVSSTGVAGLTLGGGIGALRGLHGLAVDNLRAADVVLADGTVTRADADNETDLFWALRGGGGNFGIVVGLEFAVHPVAEITTGLLGWPLAHAQEVAAAYRARADGLPDRVVAELVFGHDEQQRPTMMVVPRVIGSTDAAKPLLGDLRAAATPSLDTVVTRHYTEGQSFMDGMALWGQRVYWHTTTLRHLGDEVIDILAYYTRRAPSRSSAINVEHFHGAISRVAANATAVGFRHAPYNVFVEAKWDDPGADADNEEWVRELVAALAPYSAGGAYVNYLPRDAGDYLIRQAYGEENYARLRAVKSAYDPGNLLRTNQNIPPAAVAA